MSEELFTVEVRVNRCNFEKETFRIFSCIPLDRSKCPFRLSEYGTFSLKGDLPYIDVGKEYTMILREMSRDARYGSCCEVYDVPSLSDFDVHNLPREEAFDILRNCSTTSDRLANNILDAYPNFIEIILTEGQEAIDLSKIKGVGEHYLNAYSRKLLERYKYYGMLRQFKPYGITMKDCKTLSKYYTIEELTTKFEKDPYGILIVDLEHSYKVADNKILEVRPELRTSDLRCSYFVRDILSINEDYGNTRLSGADLYDYAVNQCDNPEFFEKGEDGEEQIVRVIKESEILYYDEATTDVSIATTYNAECAIRDLVIQKTKYPHPLDIDWQKYMNIDGFELTEEQGKLLELVCNYDISMLIGRAGSGKTSSVKALVKMLDEHRYTYTLLTPTGASALRLAQQTHKPTSTIHRKCLRDKEIFSDVIIIDEFGMVGLDTFMMLLNCITNPKCKIVLTGDPFQLPSISKGCVFADLIDSGKVPMAELTKVFRYDSNGGAFVGENIRQGKSFFYDDRVKHVDGEYKVMDDYRFIQTDDIFDSVLNEYRRLRKKYKEDEIIVLSPFNKGDCGTYALNSTIENEFNPPKPYEKSISYERDGATIIFRVGSRVVNTHNDYSALPYESWQEVINSNGELTSEDVELTQVFNGQIGVVRQIIGDCLVIQFDEELLVFDKDKTKNLLLARAISTHRSQGGEWKAVINIVSPMHTRLLSKQLLYVSNTRMKECHCDIGDKQTLEVSLGVDVISQRYTWLKELLINE